MSCPQLAESGVYILGALPPAERLAYEKHLVTCDECRAEVSDLAGLPGLLGRLDEATAAAIGTSVPLTDPAPASLLSTTVARLRRQRRVRRFTGFAVAAAAACLALVIGIVVPQPLAAPVVAGPSPSASSRAPVMHNMVSVGASNGVTATVGLIPLATGTEIKLTCWYKPDESPAAHPPGDDSAALWLFVVPRTGSGTNLRWWRAEPGDVLTISALTKLSMAQISLIELRDDAGTPLLAYFPT
jgi:hypothetical protein